VRSNSVVDSGSSYYQQQSSPQRLGTYYTFNASQSKYKGTGAGKDTQERLKD